MDHRAETAKGKNRNIAGGLQGLPYRAEWKRHLSVGEPFQGSRSDGPQSRNDIGIKLSYKGNGHMYPVRKSNRLPNYDYSTCNYYFITICSKDKRCIFGKPDHLNWIGNVVREHILRLSSYYHGVTVDKYTVMPNHVHLIIFHEGKDDPGIPQIINLFKTSITKEVRAKYPDIVLWQRSFHDHIIRNRQSYEKIWLYIEANPQNWEKDCFYLPKMKE